MIKAASSICLLGVILILTACSTTKATAIGVSNTPVQYTTYAPGTSPPQVLYSTRTDSDNIPIMSDAQRDQRLAPAIDVPQLQEQITVQQLNVIDDSNIF
jgi:hypothetical protein